MSVLKIILTIHILLFLPIADAQTPACRSFFQTSSAEHTEIQKKFETVSQNFTRYLRGGLPRESASEILHTLAEHRVTGLDRLPFYDPQGLIGFCFGRSFAAYLIERQLGVPLSDIRNLFIIGDLRSSADPEWRFHVTNVVRLANGAWYAIDPIIPQNRPVPIAEWVKTVRQIWDKKNKAMLYLTSPHHILPDIRNMAPSLDLERGLDIIDISFNPKTKNDIEIGQTLGKSLSVPYYEMKNNARPYFLEVDPKGSLSFSFDQLTINGTSIHFNGYFNDLLESVLNPGAQPAIQPFVSLATSPVLIRPSALGMVFNQNFWNHVQRTSQ